MGVDKYNTIDGIKCHFLFIAILTPINMYMRKLRGDSALLPQASILSLMVLGENEIVWTDSEDLESCFNLFSLPIERLGFFVFSLRVPASAETLVLCRMSLFGRCPWGGSTPSTSYSASFDVRIQSMRGHPRAGGSHTEVSAEKRSSSGVHGRFRPRITIGAHEGLYPTRNYYLRALRAG